MNRAKYLIPLMALVLAALVAPFLWPRSSNPPAGAAVVGMPWQIEVSGDGGSRVFGIAPGVTPMAEAMRLLGTDAQLAIVIGKDGEAGAAGQVGSVEAYFESLSLGALTGKMILTAAVAPDQVLAMQQRASKTDYMASGSKRAQLNQADRDLVERMPVAAISFIPSANLDEATVLQRFGTPAERLRSSEHTEHFLYPDKGLDLVLDSKGKELLQYVAPRDFARLRQPLLKLKTVVSP